MPRSTLHKWTPWALWGLYGVVLLAPTVRAWMKFDVHGAAKVLGLGLALGLVLWRAGRYARGILKGGRSQFPT